MEQLGHKAEPKGGSLRTADGEEADLFALADYPVDAVCRVCKGAIRARSFMRPFEHVAPTTEEEPATEQEPATEEEPPA